MRSRVSHSKYKNTGILFELLTRQVTADVLSEREHSPALDIIREFFRSNTELGRELQLYRVLMEATKLSEPRAIKFLDIVLDQRRRLSEKRLVDQKYALINTIRSKYPLKEFLASKIPQYRIYASIYKTFVGETHPDMVDVSDIRGVATSRFTIVEHMASNVRVAPQRAPELVESFKKQEEDLRLLTYRILVDRFNEKYQGLDKRQKTLLREYINNISNTNSLREYINTEVPRVQVEIEKRMFMVDDAVTSIKLDEVMKQLETVKRGQTVRDNQVTALLIAYEIVKEIDEVKGQ